MAAEYKLGAKRAFISTAFTPAQIQDIHTNWLTGTPHMPVSTSSTPHPWFNLKVDLDATFNFTRFRPSIDLGSGDDGVAVSMGDRPDRVTETTFNVSDLQKDVMFNYLSPDPRYKSATARHIPIETQYALDYTPYAVSVVFTDMNYGYTDDATYGRQPKIGTGADPRAIIIYKATLWAADYTFDGGNTQLVIPVTLVSLAADGTTSLGLHGCQPADLTLFADEA